MQFHTSIAAWCMVVLMSCSPPTPNYGDQTLSNMREFLKNRFEKLPGSLLRPVFASFDDYTVRLGVSKLKVILAAYEGISLVNACISQFEITPDSGRYMDCTFVIRPNADLRAPIMHGDALSTSFSMDIYNVNPTSVSVDVFLGDRIDKINRGLVRALPYQRKPIEEGGNRGKYTPHLDPYKSAYRIEIEKPDTDDPETLRIYWDTVYEVMTLYVNAFLESLAVLQPEDNETLIQGNMNGIDTFITTIWENDIVVPMGKLMFKEDMELYF
ncbi:MAG: hypothetical protein N3B18_13570, partial [Desulfobacterota bacterium]|nr:hypothetical protein [Thermodesulfobacteriota bacterium]